MNKQQGHIAKIERPADARSLEDADADCIILPKKGWDELRESVLELARTHDAQKAKEARLLDVVASTIERLADRLDPHWRDGHGDESAYLAVVGCVDVITGAACELRRQLEDERSKVESRDPGSKRGAL